MDVLSFSYSWNPVPFLRCLCLLRMRAAYKVVSWNHCPLYNAFYKTLPGLTSKECSLPGAKTSSSTSMKISSVAECTISIYRAIQEPLDRINIIIGPGHHEIKGEIRFLLKNVIILSNKGSLFSLKTFLHPEYFYPKNTNYYSTLICIGLN